MKTLLTLPAIALFCLNACTTQAWYEGVKHGAELECSHQPPGERERCMDRINKKTYDEYEKGRKAQ